MKKTVYSLFSVLLFTLLSIGVNGQAKLFHVFCSTFEDAQLEAEKSQEQHKKFFRGKARKGELDVKYIELIKDSFNLNNLDKVIQEITAHPEAYVFFQIVDHGTFQEESVLPTVQCYQNARSSKMDAIINPEEDILARLKEAAIFTFMFVDACNAEPPTPSNQFRSYPSPFNQPATKYYKQNTGGKVDKKIIKRKGQGKQSFNNHPLALMLSSEGYISVSSSSRRKSAYAVKGAGPIASNQLFRELHKFRPKQIKNKELNWINFLTSFRHQVDQSARKNVKSQQHPIWEGYVNNEALPEPNSFFLEKVDKQTIKSSEITEAKRMVLNFCKALNEEKGERALKTICRINNVRNVLFHDNSPAVRSKPPIYNLSDYLSPDQDNYRNNKKIVFDLDSIIFAGQFLEANRNYAGFRVKRRLQAKKQDSWLEYQISVEVSGTGQYRLNRVENIPIVIPYMEPLHPLNGKFPEDISPPSPPESIPLDEIVGKHIKTMLNRVVNKFHSILRETHNFKDSPETGAQWMARRLFLDMDSTIIDYSTIKSRRNKSVNPPDYVSHFWEDFPRMYDSVSFEICLVEPLVADTLDNYLDSLGINHWEGKAVFEQLFTGSKNGKVVYRDKTTKQVTIQIKLPENHQIVEGLNPRFDDFTKITEVKVMAPPEKSQGCFTDVVADSDW